MSSSQLHIAVYHLDRGGAFLLIMKWSASMFRFDAGFDRTSVPNCLQHSSLGVPEWTSVASAG